jgi:hypothetical protein
MSRLLRRTSSALAFGAAFVSLSACSGATSEADAIGTSGETAVVEVEADQFSVTVRNRAGRPLIDVQVSIAPVGGATTFTASVPRMEASEKRDFSLATFRGRDGTPFSLRVVRPKAVTVTARDLGGQTHEVTIPWRR